MILPVIATFVILGLVALAPTSCLVGFSAVTVFLSPLAGALVAAFAAELELAIGGGLLGWFIVLAAAVNGLTALYWWRTRGARAGRHAHRPDHRGWTSNLPTPLRLRSLAWPATTFVVIAVAAGWSLRALQNPLIDHDGNSIWLLHALFVYGGHDTWTKALHDTVYTFSNQDYPPLVPATSALGFMVHGAVNLHLGVATTVVLSACALGAVACGIAKVAGPGAPLPARVVALVAGALVCLGGFGVAGPRELTGSADLVWAAAAVAAVIFGLALPRSGQHLAVAWLAATVAAMTKNEGLVAALVVVALVAIRYVPRSTSNQWRLWSGRAVLGFVMVLPALSWSALMRHLGVHDAFFASKSVESAGYRIGPTVRGMVRYLVIVPVGAFVAMVGTRFLKMLRQKVDLAHSAWLWAVTAAYLVSLFGTYVLGANEIHRWLTNSVSRTTIFPRLLTCGDLALWVAMAASAWPDGRTVKGAPRAEGPPEGRVRLTAGGVGSCNEPSINAGRRPRAMRGVADR